jgi:hypothetical protein
VSNLLSRLEQIGRLALDERKVLADLRELGITSVGREWCVEHYDAEAASIVASLPKGELPRVLAGGAALGHWRRAAIAEIGARAGYMHRGAGDYGRWLQLQRMHISTFMERCDWLDDGEADYWRCVATWELIDAWRITIRDEWGLACGLGIALLAATT